MKELIKLNIKRMVWSILKHKYKCKIGKYCNISLATIFEGKNKIGNNVIIGKSKIGFGTYIGDFCIISNAVIGKYCSIAPNVKIIVGEHPTNTFVSTHPAFFSLLKQSGFTYTEKQIFNEIKYINEKEKITVIIGNDVWIGQDVRILSGIKIGDGAIIGAGSLVTKDIEPYGIYAGVPAKKIKNRFNDEEKDFLLDYKWWNKDEFWIKNNVNIFSDISIFMKAINNENKGENKNE